MFEKILLPVDGSEYSKKALMTAITFHKKFGSKIIAFFSLKHDFPSLRMITYMPVMAPGYSSSWMNELNVTELEREQEIMGKSVLENVEQTFKEADIDGENYQIMLVKDKSPVEYIKEFLKDEECDLIIIGVKGHNSTIKKKRVGSVTDTIVKSALCNVLIVK